MTKNHKIFKLSGCFTFLFKNSFFHITHTPNPFTLECLPTGRRISNKSMGWFSIFQSQVKNLLTYRFVKLTVSNTPHSAHTWELPWKFSLQLIQLWKKSMGRFLNYITGFLKFLSSFYGRGVHINRYGKFEKLVL